MMQPPACFAAQRLDITAKRQVKLGLVSGKGLHRKFITAKRKVKLGLVSGKGLHRKFYLSF
jgi:hypothetical protein